MSKIHSLKDLPEWFQLSSYENSCEFSALDWFASLSIRKDILHFIKAIGDLGVEFSDFLGKKEGPKSELCWLRHNPLDWRSGNGWLWYGKNYELDAKIQPVKSLYFEHLLYKIADEKHESESSKDDSALIKWKILFDADDLDIPQALQGVPVGSISGEGETVLVDLRASDADIMASFSAWLKSKRETQEQRPSRRKRLYEHWSRYGLLPYLDLKIWTLETNSRIPDRVMSAAISTYDAGESNLRKTVASLAAELMRDLSEIQALASVEQFAGEC